VSGNSPIHTKTLTESLLREFKNTPVSVSGMENGKWILIDYDDIMVHIFTTPARTYYKLEKLWADIAV